MPKNTLQQFIKEELQAYLTQPNDRVRHIICTRCRGIFSGELKLWKDDDQYITLRWNDDLECRVCALLHEQFWPAGQPFNIDEIVDLRYWFDIRDGWLFGIFNLNFDLFADENEEVRHLRLAMQHRRRPSVSEPVIPPFDTDLGFSTASPESLRRADKWLNECLTTHKVCRAISATLQFCPQRLVEIVKLGREPFLRLVRTSSWKCCLSAKYATLSHCWGNSVHCKLSKSNLNAFYDRIPYSKLSKVFQDALYVTMRAGLRYLWIDSLCIIQDDKKDWLREAAQMGPIYKNGILNIAATGFSNGSHGLFASRNPSTIKPVRLDLDYDTSDYLTYHPSAAGGMENHVKFKKQGYFLFDIDVFLRGVDQAPLNQRGWVVQERSLSLRTLHFGSSQLFWECAEVQASELFYAGFSRGIPGSSSKLFIRDKDDYEGGLSAPRYVKESGHLRYGDNFLVGKAPERLDIIQELSKRPIMGMFAGHWRWKRVVEKYSSCGLTRSNDKLVAVAGVAKDLSSYMNCAYHAGLWESGIAHQLLWKVSNPLPAAKSNGVRGPSWSWAAVDGAVLIDAWHQGGDVRWLAKVVQVGTRASGRDGFGQVHSGKVVLSGLLGALRLDPDGETRGSINSDVIVDIPRRARLHWDTSEFEERFYPSGDTDIWRYATYGARSGKKKAKHKHGASDCFLMPFRTMGHADGRDYDMPYLVGLLLLPTGQANGQYRRVGLLEISDHWWENEHKPFTNPTRILSPQYFVSVERDGWYTINVI